MRPELDQFLSALAVAILLATAFLIVSFIAGECAYQRGGGAPVHVNIDSTEGYGV